MIRATSARGCPNRLAESSVGNWLDLIEKNETPDSKIAKAIGCKIGTFQAVHYELEGLILDRRMRQDTTHQF